MCGPVVKVRYEPMTALRSGQKGLDDLSIIINSAGRYLLENGHLLVEHGYDQEQAVLQLFRCAGFRDVACIRDYAAQPRVSLGRWPGSTV